MKHRIMPVFLLASINLFSQPNFHFTKPGQIVYKKKFEDTRYNIEVRIRGEFIGPLTFTVTEHLNVNRRHYHFTGRTVTATDTSSSYSFSLEIERGLTADRKDSIVLKLEAPARNIILYDTIWIMEFEENENQRKLEVIQFTDFLGFENDRPNGIYQQEIRFKWPIIKKWDCLFKSKKLKVQIFRSLVLPDVLFNRVDKGGKDLFYPYGTAIPNKKSNFVDSIRPYLTTMDILKYSSLQISARIVPLAFKYENFRLQFQYTFTLFRNKPFIADSVKFGPDSSVRSSGDLRSIYSFGHRLEFFAKSTLNPKKDLNIVATGGILWLRLKDSYFKQFDATSVDPFNRATSLLPISESVNGRKVAPIYYFSTRLDKEFGNSNGNTVFVRFSYWYQKGVYVRVLNKPTDNDPIRVGQNTFHNHFLQVQVGISFDIEKMFNGSNLKPSS